MRRGGGVMSMGKREKPQPVSWKSQLSPPSSHLSIVIAYFFYRCTAVRTSSNSSVSPEIAIRATMNNDRSSGGSSNGTTPPPSAGNDHEVAPPPPYPTFGGLLDAEVSFDGEQGPPVRSAGPAGLAGSVGRAWVPFRNSVRQGVVAAGLRAVAGPRRRSLSPSWGPMALG